MNIADLLRATWRLSKGASHPWLMNRNGKPALSGLFSGPDRQAMREALINVVNTAVETSQRVERALEIAMQSAGVDGDHHKAWVIDQMIRALTDCQIVERSSKDSNGQVYFYSTLGESEAYQSFLRRFRAGEDGPETYHWNEGIAP